ncbi:MAG TPA: serine/threonine-protein kinase [Solirubrobacteraceae bacterium]|nr:serine/threonine-protein kinase [Solirubrobacteraceae bacterium]
MTTGPGAGAPTRRIGRYGILGELGRGANAIVYLASCDDAEMVALKELVAIGDDEIATERFVREAKFGEVIEHPNIVAVLDHLEHEGAAYMALELVDGGDLRALVTELSLPQLGAVLEGVLSALAYAGARDIVHRDLKPENILLTANGEIKVSDFGIAKLLHGDDHGLTRMGTTVGTPGYMSPEQAMGIELTPRADLYAAGCIAFEALTGGAPFHDLAPAVRLLNHASRDVPDPRTLDAAVLPGVAEWVVRMTARDPEARFADAGAAWTALDQVLVDELGSGWYGKAGIEPKPAQAGQIRELTDGFMTFAGPVALYEAMAADPPPPDSIYGRTAPAQPVPQEPPSQAAEPAAPPEPAPPDEPDSEEAPAEEAPEEGHHHRRLGALGRAVSRHRDDR